MASIQSLFQSLIMTRILTSAAIQNNVDIFGVEIKRVMLTVGLLRNISYTVLLELRPQVEHDGAGGYGALCGFGGMEVMTHCDICRGMRGHGDYAPRISCRGDQSPCPER